MSEQKCPGQDTRYWTLDDVFESLCPHCGYSIEFFRTILIANVLHAGSTR